MLMLLIEDDPTIAHELTLRWVGRGWQLQWAATLAAARAALGQPGLFDLVLLDLSLPGRPDTGAVVARVRGAGHADAPGAASVPKTRADRGLVRAQSGDQ